MLIDWLTLRYPLDSSLNSAIHQKIMANMGKTTHVSAQGEIVWIKSIPDWEAIRSDSEGLFWTITYDAQSVPHLTIGASPASLLNDGLNVFGNLDIEAAAKVLIKTAAVALSAILPAWNKWDCRRIDITDNYDLGGFSQVKAALRSFLQADASRRKSSSDSKGSDSVYWNGKSTLRSGKAYHKGAHVRYLRKKGKIECSDDICELADSLLRLELKLGSAWFRRFTGDWRAFTPKFLAEQHSNFFSPLIGSGTGVNDMSTMQERLEKVTTKGRAQAALKTLSCIRSIGKFQTLQTMSEKTYSNHLTYLRKIGLTDADFDKDNVLQFRREIVLGESVTSWEELRSRRAA